MMETLTHPGQPPPQSTPFTIEFLDHLISRLADHAATSHGHQPSACHEPGPAKYRPSFSTLHVSQIPEVKKLMLTLHCIFPNEILLALDVLDRSLVKQFVRGDNQPGDCPADAHLTTSEDPVKNEPPTVDDIFLVLSASTAMASSARSLSSSKPRSSEVDQKGYEVRLRAWNCTCPTFTLAAFRDIGPRSPAKEDGDSLSRVEMKESLCESGEPKSQTSFGGTLTLGSTKSSPPVCKHLLACLLAVRCPGIFGLCERDTVAVGTKELAGWCAGWGG
ncbi:hypothetical protein BO71DRAFT_35369 [Aspergillus ellipticus CBS 707.79]|uniref:SWIM-type domain-containing protein n=1 Tax=Aspergillus ellipticus CBS 707.79 TaxID=1448320 RepID=A0A319DL95_9EURO|nr:hypothetical protein BO71DRAFT_35369 [Aspergillus ellipticus CBS 707.79]